AVTSTICPSSKIEASIVSPKL
ncbi:hypothetical protein CP02DC14_1212B, partial [Chlamydia psittaci 02DC14]